LKQASSGLLFPSETDAPLEPFVWKGEEGKPDKERVLELIGQPAGTRVKVMSLDSFFKEVTQEQDWYDAEEKQEVQKFRQLVEAITSKRPRRATNAVRSQGWEGWHTGARLLMAMCSSWCGEQGASHRARRAQGCPARSLTSVGKGIRGRRCPAVGQAGRRRPGSAATPRGTGGAAG
jgi:hypothetical protein